MDYWDPTYEDALNLLAKLPEIAAFIYRLKYKGGDIITPDSKLADAIWQKAEFEELGVYLNAMLSIRNVTNLYAINQLNEILNVTNEFLVRINNYSNSPNR